MQRIRHYYENFTHCNQMKYDRQEAINDEELVIASKYCSQNILKEYDHILN